MENVRKNRDIKLVTTDRRRNYWVLESDDETTKLFTENLLTIEMKTKQRYLWINLSIEDFQLSKILMYVVVWLCKTQIL